MIDSANGNTSITIDADDYNEFYVIQSYVSNNVPRFLSYVIPSIIMTSNHQQMYNGFNYSTSAGKGVVTFTKTEISSSTFVFDGVDVLSSITTTVYGR